jgi:hypothetical protein
VLPSASSRQLVSASANVTAVPEIDAVAPAGLIGASPNT